VAEKATAEPKKADSPPVTILVPVLMKESRFFADGKLDQVVVQTWSDDLKRKLTRVTYEASRPDPVAKTSYDYKGDKLITETSLDPSGIVKSKVAYSYAASGLLSEEKRMDAKGQVLLASRYEYDAQGRRTAWKVYHSGEELAAVTAYEYDAKGLARILMLDGAGKSEGSVEISRDAAGREAKRVYKEADGTVSSVETVVYEGNRIKEERSSGPDGDAYLVTTYEYGALDAPSKRTVKDRGAAVMEMVSYEYQTRKEEGHAK
jgi:hypothetical protein